MRQLKGSIAAETEARALADSACTLLQQQAQTVAEATAQREVGLNILWERPRSMLILWWPAIVGSAQKVGWLCARLLLRLVELTTVL